ncbi:MAG TPA: DinB family protein [Bacteroidia bacterium]|jgi:hypothetical protein|nr:DinB family protein [Bacteroidia bacterium]
MKKDQIKPMPEYFDRYINKVDDVPLLQALTISLKEIDELPLQSFQALGDQVYAPGKWTIKDILQHMIDTERVFTYRATAFSRKEPGQVLSFDENLYVTNANANHRSMNDIIHEMKIVRSSLIELYKSFSDDMLLRKGRGSTGEYSVLAIGFIIAGHQRWHLDVIKERYFPLLKK